MKAFDTDILTEILAGNPAYAERIAKSEGACPLRPPLSFSYRKRGNKRM